MDCMGPEILIFLFRIYGLDGPCFLAWQQEHQESNQSKFSF